MQDEKIVKKSPPAYHHTNLSGHIFATKAHIDNRKKKLLKAISPPHVPTIWCTSAHYRLRSVGEFGAPQLFSTGFVSWVLPPLLHTTIIISCPLKQLLGRLWWAIPRQCLCSAVAWASDLLLCPKCHSSPLLFGPCLLWPNDRPSQLLLNTC